jgi:hypothetical protein
MTIKVAIYDQHHPISTVFQDRTHEFTFNGISYVLVAYDSLDDFECSMVSACISPNWTLSSHDPEQLKEHRQQAIHKYMSLVDWASQPVFTTDKAHHTFTTGEYLKAAKLKLKINTPKENHMYIVMPNPKTEEFAVHDVRYCTDIDYHVQELSAKFGQVMVFKAVSLYKQPKKVKPVKYNYNEDGELLPE